MGYTNYWTPKKLNEEQVPEQFWKDSIKALDGVLSTGVRIGDWVGKDERKSGSDIVNATLMSDNQHPSIVFNGLEELQEDYESFVLCFDGEWNFCKTARMPYDLAVKCLLILADKYGLLDEWSFDGDCEEEEYVKAHDLLFKLQLI